MKKLIRIKIIESINEFFFFLGIFCIFISVWSKGWNILRFFITGILLCVLTILIHSALKDIKIQAEVDEEINKKLKKN